MAIRNGALQVADRMAGVSYGIRDARIDKLIHEASASGKPLIQCTLGNPPVYGLHPPRRLRSTFVQLSLKGHLDGYATSTNSAHVAEAVAAFEGSRGVRWAHSVMFAPGSSNVIAAFLMAYLNPGDEVLCPKWLYPLYSGWFAALGVVPVFYEFKLDGQIDLDVVKSKITDRTRLFLLIDPGNPYPVVQDETTLQHLVEMLRPYGHQLMVLHDFAYDGLVYPDSPFQHSPLGAFIRRDDDLAVFVTNTMSKLFRWCGQRSGWGFFVGSMNRVRHIVPKVGELISMNLGGNRPAIELIPYALRWYDMMVRRNARQLGRRRTAFRDGLGNAPDRCLVAKPHGAIYLWMRQDWGPNREVQEALLRRGLLLTSGTVFGEAGEGYFRLVVLPTPREMFRAGRILRDYGRELSESGS